MTCADCLESLGPYVDGELPTDEAAVVEEHLTSCADCAAAHGRLVTTSSQLRAGLTRYPAPDVLKARIRAALVQTNPQASAPPRRAPFYRVVSWPSAIAAAAVVAVLSSALTFSVTTGRAEREEVQSELLATHIRSLMPGHLTDVASNDQHNVKPWFNGRVDMSPNVPRLDSLGFPLVGGRIDYIAGRGVPVIVYTRRQHVINVYSWPGGAANEPSVTVSSHGYNLMRIPRSGEELWIVSDLNPTELGEFARLLVAKT
ncbi:MAG: anti-sigma factor family protein [Gemmatimonadaceae bacterium]